MDDKGKRQELTETYIRESCGLKEEDMEKIAECIWLAATDFESKADYIRGEVTKICDRYPLY